VRQGPLRFAGALVLTVIGPVLLFLPSPAVAQGRFDSGSLTGVVLDSSGTPQMGANVEVVPELGAFLHPADFLTNTRGIFHGGKLAPGLYTVRVTLAGFLPTLHQHIRISANMTTLVRVQMESMFAALDQLRKQPGAATNDADDWSWVLRSAPGMRPILQWNDGDLQAATLSPSENPVRQPKMLFQFTDGSLRPGSVANVASAPGTAVAYDQKLGGAGRLLVAGQVSYQDQASAGVATVWLPSGMLDAGPYTALVVRRAKLGQDGLTFRGIRVEQGGAVPLGDRSMLKYRGEYVLVGLGTAASSLRPRLELDSRLTDDWSAQLIFTSQPAGPEPLDSDDPGDAAAALSATINELDTFPALMMRDGHPVLQGGWHEEISVRRKLGSRTAVQVAAFHDSSRHTSVFGRGADLPQSDFFQDVFSNGFAYDGGSGSSWGGRLALQHRLNDDLAMTTVYSFGGALEPKTFEDGILRDDLRMAPRQSFGANLDARFNRSGSRVSVGYKWVDGTALSRVDGYGETLYQMEPYLHFVIRQQLPKFGPGHWEAMADCDNLLAQGYVRISTQDGQLVLVPAFRSFRGGLSVQF
jgi:Carboxypeptidase regulatory-like domain